MPLPVSLTRISTTSLRTLPVRRSADTVTVPSCVNLTAFDTRFSSTCRKRVGSPSTQPTGPESSRDRRLRFWSARGSSVSSVCAISASRSKASRATGARPSIRVMSSTSFTRSSRIWAEFLSTGRYCRRATLSGASSIRSIMPRMPFSGVRISWLTTPRNRALARSPASAWSRDCFSSASAAIWWVMSRRTQT